MTEPHCDIVGELSGRTIYTITDSIFFYLDWASLKNASLVSKAWREAALVALRTIISSRGNPNLSSQQKRLRVMARNHLALDFHIPKEDSKYIQCFANTMHLTVERMQQGYTADFELSLDYLPFSFNSEMPCGLHLENCHFEMSDKFIVAFDYGAKVLQFWSRRTLLPLNLDEEFRMHKYRDEFCGVGRIFTLWGNDLIYGEIFAGNESYDLLELTKVDLDAKCRGMNDEAVTVMIAHLEIPDGDEHANFIRQVGVIKDFILLVLIYGNDDSKYHVTVLWKAEEAEEDIIDLRLSSMLQIPITWNADEYAHRCFFDANYFVTKWAGEGFRTYSLHPRKAGRPVELRLVASFKVEDSVQFEYKDGFLASASSNGIISFVDIVKGVVVRKVKTPVDCPFAGNEFKLTHDYLICSKPTFPSTLCGWTSFYVWDLKSILRQPVDKEETAAICVFKTLAGHICNFKVDDLGIGAAMESNPDRAIQVLSFLPSCNGCKRVTRPAMLKRCSRCKSATYCSEECHAADWDPHHKAICGRMFLKSSSN